MRPGLEIQEKSTLSFETLFYGESADVPEDDIVADLSLRFLRSAMATGTPRKPCSVWTILLCM